MENFGEAFKVAMTLLHADIDPCALDQMIVQRAPWEGAKLPSDTSRRTFPMVRFVNSVTSYLRGFMVDFHAMQELQELF